MVPDMVQYVQDVVTSRLPVNIPLPAIEISSLGIPFSTDNTRWPMILLKRWENT